MKTIRVNFDDFNIINKVLLLAGHKDLAYEIVKTTEKDGPLYVYHPTEDGFDLIVKLLIIADDIPGSQALGYNIISEN